MTSYAALKYDLLNSTSVFQILMNVQVIRAWMAPHVSTDWTSTTASVIQFMQAPIVKEVFSQEQYWNYDYAGTYQKLNDHIWMSLYLSVPCHQYPLSLLCLNLNPSRDKWLHLLWSVGWNDLSIPELQRLYHWSLKMDKYFHPTLYWACDYLYMLGLELNHVSKRSPGRHGAP